MKILIDARFYGLKYAGLGRYTKNLIDELIKLDDKNKYTLLLRKKYYKSLKLPANWKKVKADFGHYTLSEQIKLPKLLNKQDVDLVHFPHLNIPIFWQGDFVVTLHDMTMHKRGRDATTLSLLKYLAKGSIYRYVFRTAVNKSIQIIVPSNSVKKDIVNHYQISKDKIRVIYEGFDFKITDSISGSNISKVLKKYQLINKKYLLYVGNTYPHKNLDRAIEAVSGVNKKGHELYFLIASSRNIFTDRLRNAAEEYGVEKYIKFSDFIPDNELGVLLNNSLAFIYPSLSEGFGLQGIEALASGTLLLASNIPTFKEIYKDNAQYFNPYDFSSIVKTIQDAISLSSQERQRIINNGQRFIKRYSWAKMAKQTLKIYEDCNRLRSGK